MTTSAEQHLIKGTEHVKAAGNWDARVQESRLQQTNVPFPALSQHYSSHVSQGLERTRQEPSLGTQAAVREAEHSAGGFVGASSGGWGVRMCC